MSISFAEMNELLRQINQNLVRYHEQLREEEVTDPTSGYTNGYDALQEGRLEDFDRTLKDQFGALITSNPEDKREKLLEPVAACQIIDSLDEAVESQGLLGFAIRKLNTLKQMIIEYQTDMILHETTELRSHYVLSRNMLAGGDIPSPLPETDEDLNRMVRCASNYDDLMRRLDLDRLRTFFGKFRIEDVVEALGNDNRAVQRLKQLEERLSDSCLETSISLTRDVLPSEDTESFDSRRNYSFMLLQLDELKHRISLAERKKGLGNDYTQRVDERKERLEAILRHVGGEGFMWTVCSGDVDVAQALMEAANAGPRNREMAKLYIEAISREIRNMVFGENITVDHYELPKGFLIVTEPRQYVCGVKNRFTEEHNVPPGVMQWQDPYLHAMVTTHTLIKMPPDIHADGRFKAMKYRIVDFFRNAAHAGELNRLTNMEVAMDEPGFADALTRVELPLRHYRIVLPHSVLFQKRDLSDREEILLPGRVKAYIGNDDSGIHDGKIQAMVRLNRYNEQMGWAKLARKYGED